MPHQDSTSDNHLNVSLLKSALLSIFAGCDFSAVSWKNQCTWTQQLLASVAMLWAWSDEPTLTERFENTRRIGLRMFGARPSVAGSYQAFMKLLDRWTTKLIHAIQIAFRSRMMNAFSESWKADGFVLFGVDGSKIALPRTKDLEESCSANRSSKRKRKRAKSRSGQRKASNPQILLTTLWHAGTGLPWDWRCGPSDDSERHHLLQMLDGLPADALITGDAGFVGYDFWKAIADSGRPLLVRVGANVKLLKNLGYAREYQHTVFLWPDKAASRHQEPLVLRLAVFSDGKQMMHIVTTLPKCEASDETLLRLYRRRWGIELYYRQLKQTFGRRQLKSKSTKSAHVELQWSLAGLWAMSLQALPQIREAGFDPDRLSSAKMLSAYRRILRDWLHRIEKGQTLDDRLAKAVKDGYKRKNKSSRGTPRKRTVKPPGRPQITKATEQQRQHAKLVKTEMAQ